MIIENPNIDIKSVTKKRSEIFSKLCKIIRQTEKISQVSGDCTSSLSKETTKKLILIENVF